MSETYQQIPGKQAGALGWKDTTKKGRQGRLLSLSIDPKNQDEVGMINEMDTQLQKWIQKEMCCHTEWVVRFVEFSFV